MLSDNCDHIKYIFYDPEIISQFKPKFHFNTIYIWIIFHFSIFTPYKPIP